jgi:hypothetical protein
VIKGSGIDKITGISSILTDIAAIPGVAKAIPALSNVQGLDQLLNQALQLKDAFSKTGLGAI